MNDEPININEAAFERAVLQSPVPVLVDFWASWCGPCKMIAPVLEEIARENAGRVRVTKVDVDDNGPLAARFGVRNIPTLLFFEGGELRDTVVGAVSKRMILERFNLDCSRSVVATALRCRVRPLAAQSTATECRGHSIT